MLRRFSLLKLFVAALAVAAMLAPAASGSVALAADKHNQAPPKPSQKPAPKSGSGYSGYTYYPVTSQIAIDPFSGPPNQPVTVTGKWFYYHPQLTLYWDVKTHPLARVTTDNQGAFKAQVRPPDDFVGNHTVCITEASWVPCQVFGLLPRIPSTLAAAPLEGQPGTSVTLTGHNFNSNQPVNLVWGNGKTVGTLVADVDGNITGRFELPEARAGDYQICLVPVKPGQGEQPACQKMTLDAVPVAATTEQSVSLTRVFTYLIILVALAGGILLFIASRRRLADVPNATVQHRIGPSLMSSTHKEFWDSIQFAASPGDPQGSRRAGRGRQLSS